MGLLSFLGLGQSSVKKAIQNGAIIIDVRNVNEYDQGRVPASINIPIHLIAANTKRIKGMNRPVIFCCSSGSRSGQAVKMMKEKGLKEVYNGGSWQKVLKIISSM